MKKIFFFNLLLLINLSCKKNVDNPIGTENVAVDSVDIKNQIFEENLANKPKLFLDYWEGMTYDEFMKVSKKLENEGKVRIDNPDVYYNMGEHSITISLYYEGPHEENKASIGIELKAFGKETYNIFKEKYNLPNYVVIEPKYILEQNPLFQNPNENSLKVGKKISNLSFQEAAKLFNPNLDLHNTKSMDYLTAKMQLIYFPIVTTPNEIIIKKDNVVIKAGLEEKNFEYIDHLLKEGSFYKQGYVSFSYPNNDSNGETRIVKIKDFSEFKIVYLSRDYYENEQSKKNKLEKDYKNSKQQEKTNNDKRIKNVYDEI